MINPSAIRAIALCEARLLWRSLTFRLSLGLAILCLFAFNLGISLRAPHLEISLPGGFPLSNVKLLNIYLGLVGAFLATEFFKRDRREDTTQTLFVHSFSNLDYVVGKVLGVLTVFALLELGVLAAAGLLHHFYAPAPFTWPPYLVAVLAAALPTLIFSIGLAVLLVTLLRSQAVVVVLLVGVGLLSLTVLGENYFYFFDFFAFHIPLMWSDFVGTGNEEQLLLVRSTHLLFGLACIAATPLLSTRLPQSKLATATTALATLACLAAAAWTGKTYLQSQWDGREYRDRLRQLSSAAAALPAPTIATCQLQVEHAGGRLQVAAELAVTNRNSDLLDTLLFTLNPALKIEAIRTSGAALTFRRDEHLLHVGLPTALARGDTLQLHLAYAGTLDERFCYLDVERERYEAAYRFSLHTVAKRYALATSDFLHLTPETGWYPRGGVPQGTAFPASGHRDYTRYQISVAVPPGWSAFSQGALQVDSLAALHHFKTATPLPQVSLTMGPYEIRQLRVDEVDYTLAIHPEHNYFDTYLDSVSGALPGLIAELKNEYESALGMEYPHPRFSLIETPIQFFAYDRLWTVAQESVQPELVFLPEMGTLCEGCDFRRQQRRGRRRQERANQAETAESLQSNYVRTFATLDLLGLQAPRWSRIERRENLETRYKILPCFLSYVTHLSSSRWPLLNYAFESYFRERVTPPKTAPGEWSGLTSAEEANLALQEEGLAELLADEERPRRIREAALKAKGRHLLQLFAAESGAAEFGQHLTQALRDSPYRSLSEAELLGLISGLSGRDPEPLIERWYRSSELPGYELESIDSYLVLDGERTRTQVDIELSNPTEVDGLVELGFRYRQSGTGSRWSRRLQQQGDYEQIIAMPAGSRKTIGILLDRPVAEMLVDTYVSRNIPTVIKVPFGEQKLRRRARPFSGEEIALLANDPAPKTVQYIVDNEDEGFLVHESEQANWLRRTLVDLLDLRQRDVPYVGLNRWSPPGTWQPTTERGFYGQFVLSGYYKRAGDGRSVVSWRTQVEHSGEYDLYFYCGLADKMRFGRGRRGRFRTAANSSLEIQIYHEEGIEPLELDLQEAAEGWNHLGTYRLAAGPAHVEMSDRGEGGVIIADAVKWVEKL